MLNFRTLRCSFCKKTDAEVAKLVAGPRVMICDECVAAASRFMDGTPAPPHAPAPRRPVRWAGMASRVRRALGIDVRMPREASSFRT